MATGEVWELAFCWHKGYNGNMINENEITGQDLRAARLEAGLSVAAAAALIGCTRSGWTKWEAGTRSVKPVIGKAALEAIEQEAADRKRLGIEPERRGRPPVPSIHDGDPILAGSRMPKLSAPDKKGPGILRKRKPR